MWVFHNGNLINLASCRVSPVVLPSSHDNEKYLEEYIPLPEKNDKKGNLEEYIPLPGNKVSDCVAFPDNKSVRYNLRSRTSSMDRLAEDKKQQYAEKESFYTRAEYYECFDDDLSVYVVEIPTKEHCRLDVVQAKEKEMNNLQSFGTYEEIENEGQCFIDSRWVITEKEDHDGQKTKVKARIVAKGFQEAEKPQSDSPTVGRDSLKTFIAVAANMQFQICSVDITGAFLQADMLDRNVYVRPPIDIRKLKPNILWKLKKPLYGLDDSSRKFYLVVKKIFLKHGLELLPSDNAYFYCRRNGDLIGQVVIHVDDFFISGTGKFLDWLLDIIKTNLKVSKVEFGSFRFTGVDIRQEERKIVVSMNAYSDSLKPITDFRKDNNTVLLNDLELKVFRKYTGKLSWLAENCRPDLSYLANSLSKKSQCATLSDLKYVNKILKKLRKVTVRCFILEWVGKKILWSG